MGIKPISRKGELGYKWNWDAPLAVSSHKSGRLYFAANKVFRSDNYGNSWDVIVMTYQEKLIEINFKVYDRVLTWTLSQKKWFNIAIWYYSRII